MSRTTKTTSLKNPDGKYLTVRKVRRSSLQLCLIDVQDEDYEAPLVSMHQEGDKFAFCFRQERHWYYPAVSGEKLQFIKQLTDACWFRREEVHSGSWYFLRSVAEPSRRLWGEQPVGLTTTMEPLQLTHTR